jgi:hypothetical protein
VRRSNQILTEDELLEGVNKKSAKIWQLEQFRPKCEIPERKYAHGAGKSDRSRVNNKKGLGLQREWTTETNTIEWLFEVYRYDFGVI